MFRIRPFDAVTYTAVGLILTVAALVACCIPGRRATKSTRPSRSASNSTGLDASDGSAQRPARLPHYNFLRP